MGFVMVVLAQDGTMTVYGPMVEASAHRLAARFEEAMNFEGEVRTMRLRSVTDARSDLRVDGSGT